jgi:hypothetical protein
MLEVPITADTVTVTVIALYDNRNPSLADHDHDLALEFSDTSQSPVLRSVK